MGKHPTTWYAITRACGHSEAVRVAGPFPHRERILSTLQGEQCSPCVLWPTRTVDPRIIRYDLRAGAPSG